MLETVGNLSDPPSQLAWDCPRFSSESPVSQEISQLPCQQVRSCWSEAVPLHRAAASWLRASVQKASWCGCLHLHPACFSQFSWLWVLFDSIHPIPWLLGSQLQSVSLGFSWYLQPKDTRLVAKKIHSLERVFNNCKLPVNFTAIHSYDKEYLLLVVFFRSMSFQNAWKLYSINIHCPFLSPLTFK